MPAHCQIHVLVHSIVISTDKINFSVSSMSVSMQFHLFDNSMSGFISVQSQFNISSVPLLFKNMPLTVFLHNLFVFSKVQWKIHKNKRANVSEIQPPPHGNSLKGTCSRDFWRLYLVKKLFFWPQMNRQKRFSFLRRSLRKMCVGKVDDYADMCWRSRWVRQHCVGVVIDYYAETW